MKATIFPLSFVLAVAAMAAGACAQDAWNGTGGLLHLENAGTVGRGKVVFSLGSSFYRREETLTKGPLSFLNGTPWDRASATFDFFLSRAALTLGLSDYVELSASLDERNWSMDPAAKYRLRNVFDTRKRNGLGDTHVLLKLCPLVPTSYVSVGVLGEASFPTGREEPRFTTGEIDFGMKGLVTVNLTGARNFVPAKVHFNLGYRFNRNETDGYGVLYANNPDSSGFSPPAYPKSPEGNQGSFNDMVQFGTGLEFLLKRTSVFLEFMWDSYPNADFASVDTAKYYLAGSKNTYTITPGVRTVLADRIGVMLAADFNVNSKKSPSFVRPPDWTVYFMISVGGRLLSRDRDNDGIPDKVDKCPDQPEDIDGFEDDDGCPDLDNDKDGIPDTKDKCPDLAEDYDGFQDDDGCPDLDNDNDGIPDSLDKCPNEPEDYDGFEDEDGCPDHGGVGRCVPGAAAEHAALGGVEADPGIDCLGINEISSLLTTPWRPACEETVSACFSARALPSRRCSSR